MVITRANVIKFLRLFDLCSKDKLVATLAIQWAEHTELVDI